MPTDSYKHIYGFIETLPVISTHEHHLPDDFHYRLTLDRLLETSYLTLLAQSTGNNFLPLRDYLSVARGINKSYRFPESQIELRGEFLEKVRYNSYFVWFEKSIQKIYDLDGKISPDNWDEASNRITSKHEDPRFHFDILRNTAGYRRVINDPYWDYGSDLGHPEWFSSTMRTDMFVRSFHRDIVDHDGYSPFICYPDAPTGNFDDYLLFLKEMFTRWRNSGAIVMKSASAYDRSLNYGEPDYEAAIRVFYKSPDLVGINDRVAYEDFMFNWFCKLCLELEVPFQVHTGLGNLSGSNPLAFEKLLIRYPNIHFILFHAGYPWYNELAGLLHNYSNISVDMVWAPIISTYGAVQALHEFIEVAHSSDLITWGGDTWSSEEAFGALLAWRHVVAKVLSEKVDESYFDMQSAETLAEKLMYKNAAKRFGFQNA